MALVTYPLNNVDYQAEDAELFHCTRTSGIYTNDDFVYSVTGADNTITIGPGLGWIRNSKFTGKVVALKSAESKDLGIADSAYPRIDAIVLQFNANTYETDIVVKKGAASSSPAAPVVVQTEALYELHLYHVRRTAGATSVTAADITDLRLDANYCGLMGDSVTSVDTTAINAQVRSLIDGLHQEIQEVKNGSAYLMRNGTTPMTGPLQMDGHKVTGLGNPTESGDAVPLGYANENFAPAVESADYPGCYYRTVDGVIEWINPPMVPGVEYRTTERRNGRPVYTKLVNCGAIAADMVVSTGIPGSNLDIVDAQITMANMINDYHNVQSGTTIAEWDFIAWTNLTQVMVKAGTTLVAGGGTVYARFKYTYRD